MLGARRAGRAAAAHFVRECRVACPIGLDKSPNMTTLGSMNVATRIVAAMLPVVLPLAGCATVRQSFPGSTADQVWTALVVVAERPQYDDWTVPTNEVWVDEPNRRIEVYRRLQRVLYRPGAGPHRERRTWRFEIRLESTDPPEAVFESRGWGVPAQAQIEGGRYFSDVLNLLTGYPAPQPPPAPQPATVQSTQPRTSPETILETVAPAPRDD